MSTPRTNPIDQLARLKRQLASQEHLLSKLRAIRALHIVAYNSNTPVDKMAPEFFYAIGDILEGQKPTDLNLKTIDKQQLLEELHDG